MLSSFFLVATLLVVTVFGATIIPGTSSAKYQTHSKDQEILNDGPSKQKFVAPIVVRRQGLFWCHVTDFASFKVI
ncbi:hypothetical protein BDV95DRAFT_162460 [Massariosphaeria phaeospora]|uniref:Uncharacterized protein n=1 Tax=Massariosphaeria phaeospora TaxID=100035 RepID=A0A7C8M3L6_9PLEO|nr:hypothetical protein BDV95DRAFT_162460 [Massariosphaeria phaeospora]